MDDSQMVSYGGHNYTIAEMRERVAGAEGLRDLWQNDRTRKMLQDVQQDAARAAMRAADGSPESQLNKALYTLIDIIENMATAAINEGGTMKRKLEDKQQ